MNKVRPLISQILLIYLCALQVPAINVCLQNCLMEMLTVLYFPFYSSGCIFQGKTFTSKHACKDIHLVEEKDGISDPIFFTFDPPCLLR